MTLHVYNTLHNAKEPFDPIAPGVVKMFVCGPTVYDLSHIGHAKTYTQFDFIARYLKHRGYQVTYLQNITDIDDKIIKRASETGADPRDLSAEFTKRYRQDMNALHNTSVDVYALAHDHIGDIVRQIQTLIAKGHAYQLPDGWYFDLTSFPSYGKLSGRTHLLAEDSVSRIDENPHKRNPGDFALWKARKDGEPFWDTPLGAGRPGWHIEDTAITEAIFGPRYDLHGGAVDLIFPHHEAEIAQMEAASGLAPLAKYWLHTGLLRVEGAKMSKSTGNFATIRDVLQSTDFRTLRYVFLSQHYRSSLEFTGTAVEAARSARARIENFARITQHHQTSRPEEKRVISDLKAQFFGHLDDDFDTPAALAALFSHIRSANKSSIPPAAATWQFLQDVDALFDAFNLPKDEPTGTSPAGDSAINEQIARRAHLRAAGAFAAADALRHQLLAEGIILEDTPDGTRWWRKETQ